MKVKWWTEMINIAFAVVIEDGREAEEEDYECEEGDKGEEGNKDKEDD